MGQTFKKIDMLIIPTVAINNQPLHQSTEGSNIKEVLYWLGGACIGNQSVVWKVVSVDYTKGGVRT